MISHALNSGAINAVPFPSSEQGASVIELTATVEVTGTVSNITKRLYASPTTTAKAATSSPPVRFRAQLGATAQPSAVPADITTSQKTKYSGSAFCAALSSSPTAVIKRRISASAQAAATASSSAYLRVARGANTACTAYGENGAFTKIRLGATASAQAISKDTTARSNVLRAATQSAVADSITRIQIWALVGAGTAAVASATATAGAAVSRAATTQPTANGYALAYRRTSVGATTPAAANGTSGIKSKMATPAATQASAIVSLPQAFYKRLTSAYTLATAVPSVVAYDFATEIPAPVDRQIVVPPYDRTMKVVA